MTGSRRVLHQRYCSATSLPSESCACVECGRRMGFDPPSDTCAPCELGFNGSASSLTLTCPVCGQPFPKDKPLVHHSILGVLCSVACLEAYWEGGGKL